MTVEFIKDFIDSNCANFDIIVLKGFEPRHIVELGSEFLLLDNYAIEENKIQLEKIDVNKFLLSSLQLTQKAVCTCESFIDMCTKYNLDSFPKKICVLENNFFELYPNPTNINIPDFDSDEFMDMESSSLYSLFYSYCICENGKQLVQYIDNYSMFSCITVKNIVESHRLHFEGNATNLDGLKFISKKDNSLNIVLSELYERMTLESRDFVIDTEEENDLRMQLLVPAAEMMGLKIRLHKISRDLTVEPRKDLYDLLKCVWGYESFRNLNIYKDLVVNHETIEISQGTIIETVIQQSEYAYHGEKTKVKNILLTSPTGAGKSLLFQLSAIYLADKYRLLTIVVSPLVALMNDQVDGLNGYNAVATLNSNKSATEKENIKRGVQEGTINILYLSPELLLSYSITSFIGDRKLGLLVVDEAHTVTTWGRDFRVDYWFLGDYLRKARRILDYSFPIFALTATAVWDPSGKNDMVFDTIRSLNMDPCIKFIGVVRRSNILFEINQSNISSNYEEKRTFLTTKRIREALENNRKSIFYFPFRSTVSNIVNSEDLSDISDKITCYHAWLSPKEKKMNAESFRNGTKPIMCATKAFGMGVDVSDISEVYHHAPTGCLSDYVQEIGRLARDPKIEGIAKIDFSEKDFRYIRKLHGLSAIRPYQLIQVLKKLYALYKINGEKRNMLISSADFGYIFPLSNDIDQNLKSCLLLISNDLLNKLRFHSIIVRPKSLFTKNFIEIPTKEEVKFCRMFHSYISHISDNQYVLNSDKIWTEKYSNLSFPDFKRRLSEGKIFKDYNIKIKYKITLSLQNDVACIKKDVEDFFQYAHIFLNKMSSSGHRLKTEMIKTSLPASYNKMKREQFLETFRLLYATKNGISDIVHCNILNSQMDNVEEFQLMQSGYESISNQYLSLFDDKVKCNEIESYCDITDDFIKLSEFLNCLGVADYQKLGGDQPAIFVRLNNPYYLKNLINNNYENDLLNSITEKYYFSEKIFTYFFTTPMTNKQRWDFIEEYFLGASEDRLLNFVSKK